MTDSKQPDLRVDILNWSKAKEYALPIRTEVFIQEQHVPEEMEWDDEDAPSVHFIAFYRGEMAGCARLLADGHVGRVAVLKSHRRLGVASALLVKVEEYARENTTLSLLEANAQITALPFYESLGYEVSGDEFDEAGIPHKYICKSIC